MTHSVQSKRIKYEKQMVSLLYFKHPKLHYEYDLGFFWNVYE